MHLVDILCIRPLPNLSSSAHPPMMTKAREKWAIEKLHHSGNQPPTHSLAHMYVCMQARVMSVKTQGWMDGQRERLKCWREYRANIHLLPFYAKWTTSSLALLLLPTYARDSLSGPCPFPNKVIYYLLRVLPSLYLGGEAKTWRMQEMDCPQMTISV